MLDNVIIKIISSYMNLEIINKTIVQDNEIIVSLADGTKAKIIAKNVA